MHHRQQRRDRQSRWGGGIQRVRGKGHNGYVGVVDVVAAAGNDNLSVNGDCRNDDGTTMSVAVGEADATIATTTAEGEDNAPVPAPPSTHPLRAAPTTMSDNDDNE
jgi:hypothetical protein